MLTEHFYEVKAQWNEGRKGVLSSRDLDQTIACATPPEFAKGVPNIWSPEHLYVAAISSCFMTTFLAIAENSKLEFTDFSCNTQCKLEFVEGKYLITEAIVEPVVHLPHPERDAEKANKVLDKTKAACLITNSMKTTVVLDKKVVSDQEELIAQ